MDVLERLEWILVTIVVAAVVLWWASGPASDEVTTYKASCTNGISIRPLLTYPQSFEEAYRKYHKDRKDCILWHWGRRTYKINLYRSEVYYASRLSGVERLTNCAIIDSENWKCEYPDKSGYVAIINGLEAQRLEKGERFPDLFSLYRWQYWYVMCYWFLLGEGPRGEWLIPEQEPLSP
jgi:hypothetical protein